MLESLVHLDQQLLLLLNGSDSVYWDGFWVSITRVATWIFFYLFLLLVLLRSDAHLIPMAFSLTLVYVCFRALSYAIYH